MVSTVLKGGPSDHNPYIQTFKFRHHQDQFTAVTYNVNHSNTPKDVADIFHEIKSFATSIWLLQEVKNYRRYKRLFKKLGLKSKYAAPEFCIAWDPKKWEFIRAFSPQMSPTEYWTTNRSLIVVLKHKATGLKIKFMTYHPPAHVQSPNHPTFKVVFKVLREVVNKWNRIANNSAGKVYACLFGGDDNVDETHGWEPKGGWDFMLEGPLEQVRPLTGTHDARIIDEFRKTDNLIAVR